MHADPPKTVYGCQHGWQRKQLGTRVAVRSSVRRYERGYGLTVSGDNPVYVASVKSEGAAAKAGVQKDDRIVKVNGTLVLNKNHIDVVKLIRSGSYVALTLMGKPNLNDGNQQHPVTPPATEVNNSSNRNSHITAPQPVDPDIDRELLHQKVHMTRVMLEQAREDFLKQQRQYVRTPSERLHTQLLDKERTVKKLETQLRVLTGGEEPVEPRIQGSQRLSDVDNTTDPPVNSWQQGPGMPKHVKQVSLPDDSLSRRGSDSVAHDRLSANITRSNSDAAWRRHKGAATQSTFYVDLTGVVSPEAEVQATSLPVTSDTSGRVDSPHHSPRVSPTPLHPHNARHDHHDHTDDSGLALRTESTMETDSGVGHSDTASLASIQKGIIIDDDEDISSDNEQSQTMDSGTFSDIRLLEKKPAHLAVFLHYLISNSDPCALLFYLVTDMYKQTAGSTKDLRKWGYEIFSTFLVPEAPLRVEVHESLVARANEVLMAGSGRNENELVLRGMFDGCRSALSQELSEQLAEFRNMRVRGLDTIFGAHELQDNMDKGQELKMIEKYLVPHLRYCSEDSSSRPLSDRDLAMGWALATFLRQVGVHKTSSSGILERVQSFIMKDKRSFKLGSRSAKAKGVKGHQFNLQHFYVPTLCSKCEGLIWGVGFQGFLCQSCEIGVHKQCVEDVSEVCSGKKRSKRATPFVPRPKSTGQPIGEVVITAGDARSPPHTTTTDVPGSVNVQPVPKEDDVELANLGSEVSVKSIVKTYQDLASPVEPGSGEDTAGGNSRKGSTDLNRSESWKGKGDKSERPARRAKSDVDREDMFHAISIQSGSSSASSLSNRSGESPSHSSEHVNESLSARMQHHDSDLEVEELPPLKQVLGDEVGRLKSKEKKRQEVINELFHTEKAHLRNLKVLDLLFNRPMLAESGIMPDLARALFPNMDEIIALHASMNQAMKDRRSQNPVVGDVGDILLDRFDGPNGDRFRKACAEYCRNQSFALERLKHYRRKDQRLSQFLAETEADKLCRKLELKDHVPCQMQRLTKYPLLIDNLLKHSKSSSSQDCKNLEKALTCSKYILAYVNQAVRECQNHHKLKEMQKKLETRAIDASANPALMDIKNLDLTQHKLVFEGPLVWRFRSHRLIDLQVVLLEDILVLLQRVDDKLVLKCQSTNLQSIGNDFKYSHSPVLKLQNLLAREVATDKKAFFVINTSDTGPQIYELVAQTQDARKTWCRLINEKAEEHKKTLSSARKMPRVQESPTEKDEMLQVRNRILKNQSSPPPAEEAPAVSPASASAASASAAVVAPASRGQERVDNLGYMATSTDDQRSLVQPHQVNVMEPCIGQAQQVLTPIERLQRNDQQLAQALSDKEAIIAEILRMNLSDYHRLAKEGLASGTTSVAVREGEDLAHSLMAACIDVNSRLIQLISDQASSFARAAQQHGSETAPGSASVSPDNELSRLRQTQAQLAQGAAAATVSVPMPLRQLQDMALEMNKILNTLLGVLEAKEEERHTLRSQLEAAQKQMDLLKEVQQQILAHHPPSTPHSRPLSFVSITSSISEVGEGEGTDDGEQAERDTASVLNVPQTQELAQEMVMVAEEETAIAHLQPQTAMGIDPSTPPAPPHQVEEEESDDDDDGVPMSPEGLPLPDDNLPGLTLTGEGGVVGADEHGGGAGLTEVVARGDAEPMTTDLDEGGAEDAHNTTPTPSPTSLEAPDPDRDSVDTIEDEDRGDNNNEDAATTTTTITQDRDDATMTVAEEVADNAAPPGEQGLQPSTDQTVCDDSGPKTEAGPAEDKEGGEEGGEGEESENGENNNRTCQDSELTNPITI
ncbi:rho guanine nucleotide exchange factor 11-like [Babylonia areolata]|uniref:rho guanine nucleotide exchange factor 11-like n=1 Tax=Babylonia areolata TaxID=304850 RepID=UPI003FCF2533